MITFYSDTIPIVFASNDFFMPYMAAMMQSIMENSDSKRRFCFFVMNRDINIESQKLLQTQIQKFTNFKIDFIDVTVLIGKNQFFVHNRADITIETYFRLFIPKLFSAYEKVIYLDGDMICRTDIASLYDIDLGDNMIAAVRNLADINRFYRHEKNDTKYFDALSNLKNPHNYYCAGTLVFNIPQFNKDACTEKLVELALSKNWRQHDQDILNFVTEGKTYYLLQEWNFIQIENFDCLPKEFQTEYNSAKNNEKIIHFAGVREKPWICPVYVKNFEYFWMYATRTPFLPEIISRMNRDSVIGFGYSDFVINEIKQRRNGLRFILKCLKAWVLR